MSKRNQRRKPTQYDRRIYEKIGVALLGLGVVGGGTYKILTSKRDYIRRNDGIDIEIKCILEKTSKDVRNSAWTFPLCPPT